MPSIFCVLLGLLLVFVPAVDRNPESFHTFHFLSCQTQWVVALSAAVILRWARNTLLWSIRVLHKTEAMPVPCFRFCFVFVHFSVSCGQALNRKSILWHKHWLWAANGIKYWLWVRLSDRSLFMQKGEIDFYYYLLFIYYSLFFSFHLVLNKTDHFSDLAKPTYFCLYIPLYSKCCL